MNFTLYYSEKEHRIVKLYIKMYKLILEVYHECIPFSTNSVFTGRFYGYCLDSFSLW